MMQFRGISRTGADHSLVCQYTFCSISGFSLNFGDVLINWIILYDPNIFGLMTMCQVLMGRNCVIYEVFRTGQMMMPTLVIALTWICYTASSLHKYINQPEIDYLSMNCNDHNVREECHD